MIYLFETEFIILLLSGIGAFASVMAVCVPFFKRDQLAARQKAIAQRHKELESEQQERLAGQQARKRPKASVAAMKQFLERFNLSNLITSPELQKKLMMAGWRGQSASVTFVFLRLATCVGVLLFGIVFFVADKTFNLPLYGQFVIIVLSSVIGFKLPDLFLRNAAQKRQEEMGLAYPDALDLLVICVNAGLSIEAAFSRVTEEVAESSAALSQEIGLTSAELLFLGDRSKAYANLAERTGLPAIKSLVIALSQADKYGTPVSVALKILSEESRSDRMALAETKGAALPAKLTVPMILFFLPALFLVIIGPAVLQMMAL
jgi:tight adherence protein C